MELDECSKWLKTVVTRAEIAEERIAAFSEVESRYSEVESLITKIEESLVNVTETQHSAEVESKLLQLKQDWQALKMKTRKKSRHPGSLGNELESKQVISVGALTELKDWIAEARDRAMGMTAAGSIDDLKEALTVCTAVRNELSVQKARLKDVLQKGGELVAEGVDENLANKEGVEAQLEQLKSQWECLEEDLGKREVFLQDTMRQFQKLESDLEKTQSGLTDIQTKLHNFSTVGDFHTVELELQSLQEYITDAETCEAGISLIETGSQSVHATCEAMKNALSIRVGELKEKLSNVKASVSSHIQRDQEILVRRKDLATELLQCKELMNKVETAAGDGLKFETLPLLEEGVVQTTEAVTSVERALASLHAKSEQLLSCLKPSEQNVLQVEINDLKTHWDEIKGNANDRVENLEKRIATSRDFEKDLKAAKEWVEKAREEIVTFGVEPALEEHAARLKNIHSECKSPENIVNALLTKSETVLQYADETEKRIFESQLAELKNSVEDATERSRLEIDKLEEELSATRLFKEAYQELKSWVENEERSQETYIADADDSSLETKLEELKSKQHSIDSREQQIKELANLAARITNLDASGKENVETRLLDLQMSYTELKSKIAERVDSVQGESDKLKEFEAELQHCKDIVQGIESVVSSEPPSFTEIEKLESYVQELKEKFQDALAERNAIFQLGEKKDELPLLTEAAENYTEVVNKWKTLLARFSEKIAETERRIAEEKKLNESFEEVSSWVENVEKEMEISFESEQAQEVEEVVGQVEKLKTLNTECASYGQFVESLRSKVGDTPNEPSEGPEHRLSVLEARVEAMHKRLAAKLGDVENCVNDVSDVTERISSCKEWLLQKKELIVANEKGIQLGNVQHLEEKLVEFQNLNQEAATVLHDIIQAKEKVGQRVGKVSSSLEESLSKELNSLCDTLMGLHEDSDARIVELKQCLGEAREFEQEVTRYETLLHEANNTVQCSIETPLSVGALSVKLDELKDLQDDLSEKQKEFHRFLEAKEDLVAQSGVQERLAKANEVFDNLTQEIPQALKDTEAKVSEYEHCSKELEESLEWLTKTTGIIDSHVTYSLDDSSADEQLAKLKELRAELESFESKLSAISEHREIAAVIGEDGKSSLQEKFDYARRKWETLRDDACLKESSLVTFLQAKENYNLCAAKCKQFLDDLTRSVEEECKYSAMLEKSNAQLELQRNQQEKCQELEEQIRALEEAGRHVTDTCEDLREPIREEVIKLKNDWQRMNTEAVIKQEQLVAWISEIGNIRKDAELSLSRVKKIHDSLKSCKPEASDIRAANNVLGQLKQSSSELDAEKENVQNILEKRETVLAKLDPIEEQELAESFRVLQTAFSEAEEDSKERVRQAEERINDIIEFDKESARCESLLTIYQAAAPVDVACTVETLEDQTAKLKRLYGDMESRESHMTALHEKEGRLSRDEQSQSARTSPDGKAGKLQGDWGKLKASVGEKLRELERLAQMKKEFEDEYDTCLEGVQELETAIHLAGDVSGSVEARVLRMQELCARIKSYRNKLDLLTDRCNELPNVAYEQKDLDPRRKLNAVVRRWEEVKDDALGKLNELEKEKTATQNIAHEISKLHDWVQDTCAPFVNKDIPPVVHRDGLEKALLDNTEFRSILETKLEWLNELLVKTRNFKGDGQHKETFTSNLRDITRNLEDVKVKMANNDAEIKSRLKQHAKLISDLDHVRVLLLEVKRSESSELDELEGDNWIEESISSRRIELGKFESCDLLLSSVAEKIDKFTAGQSDAGETAIEQDLHVLTADVHAVKQQLSNETLQLEKLREFDHDCVELLTLFKSLTGKILAVDLHSIAETANVTYTEEQLAKCRQIDQNLSERDRDFETLVEREAETLHFAPADKRLDLEARYHQLKDNRTTLKELINSRGEALRNLVAEQQTLEGWLKKAGILIQDAATLLRENEASLTVDDTRMSERSHALAELNTKLEEYLTYSETFQGSGKANEVARVKVEMIQLNKHLSAAANELQQFKEQCEAFETEAADATTIFERCAADHFTPAGLQESQEQLASLKVKSCFLFLSSN